MIREQSLQSPVFTVTSHHMRVSPSETLRERQLLHLSSGDARAFDYSAKSALPHQSPVLQGTPDQATVFSVVSFQ